MCPNETCFDGTDTKSALMSFFPSGNIGYKKNKRKKPYLQISQLGELLAAILELAQERLDLFMYNLVCTDITSLGEALATMVARVWAFPSMSSLMCLRWISIMF